MPEGSGKKGKQTPLLDMIDAKPRILEYPHLPRFEAVRARIDQNRTYTLSQCAELTGIERTIFLQIVRPTRAGNLRFAPVSQVKPGEPLQITGATLNQILDAMEQCPHPNITGQQLAEHMGKLKSGMMQSTTTIEGKRVIPYITAEGERAYIPMYSIFGTTEGVFDARVIAFLEKDQQLKKNSFSWEEVVGYLIKMNIDVQAAQLFCLTPYYNRSTRTFTYPLLNGTTIQFKAIEANKDGGKRGIRFSKESITQLAKSVMAEQKTWMTVGQFEEALYTRLGTRSSSAPFTFTLDWKKYEFETKIRGNFAYIRRVVALAYINWRELKESKDYTTTRTCCIGASPEQTETRKHEFGLARTRINDQEAVVVAPLNGIAIPLREYSENEKIRAEGKELVGFYLTLKTGNERAIQATLGRLKLDIMETPVRIEVIIKLWILRDHWMQGSKVKTPGYLEIDELFSTQKNIGKRARELLEFEFDEISEYCKEKGKEIIIYTPSDGLIDQDGFYSSILAAYE